MSNSNIAMALAESPAKSDELPGDQLAAIAAITALLQQQRCPHLLCQ
jgi:hypothetical protein